MSIQLKLSRNTGGRPLGRLLRLAAMIGCMALAGCTGPQGEIKASSELSFFDNAEGRGAVTVHLLDEIETRRTQDVVDADAFNGALVQLSNPTKLRQPYMIATAASTGSFQVAFRNVPSDAGSNYSLRVSLFRNVTQPASLTDPGYSAIANKVGEGISAGFSVAPWSNTTATVKINTVGSGDFYSAQRILNQNAPVYPALDTTAHVDTRINALKNPLATVLNLYVLDYTGTSTLSTTIVPHTAWPVAPLTASVSFPIPEATADYKLCIEAASGSSPQPVQVLSRLYRTFGVGRPSADGRSAISIWISFDK